MTSKQIENSNISLTLTFTLVSEPSGEVQL